MAELSSLVIAIQTNGASQARADLASVTAEGGKAEAQTKRLEMATDATGVAMAKAAAETRKHAQTLDAVESEMTAARRAAEAQTGALKGLTSAQIEATKAAGAGAIAYREHENAVQRVVRGQGTAVGSSKALQAATLNLGRQFADLGTSAAMGMAPLMILIQQGPQIADAMGLIRASGGSMAGVLGGAARSVAQLALRLGPLIVVTGAAAAGFGLLHRELSRGYPKDITDGLDLTAEQLRKVESRTVTMGDTWTATLNVMGRHLKEGPIGDGLEWLQDKTTDTLNVMSGAFFEGAAKMGGAIIGTLRTIEHNWRNFPAVIGDGVAAAVNLVIEGVERMLNSTITLLNTAKAGASFFQPWLRAIPDIPKADLDRFKMTVSGAAEFTAKVFASNIEQATQDMRTGMRRIGSEISAEALRIAQDRARAEAGEAKATKDLKDSKDKLRLTEIKLLEAGEAVSANYVGRTQLVEKFTDQIVRTEDQMAALVAQTKRWKESSDALANSLDDVAYAIGGIVSGFKAGDWTGFGRNLESLIGGVIGSFRNGGLGGGFSALGQIGGALIGGRTGRGIANAAGMAGAGMWAGSALGAWAQSSMLASSLGASGGLLGGLAPLASQLAPLLGPIGVIAGLASLAKAFQKPSNRGAGFDLISGEISGKSRDQETESAVREAGGAILAGQDLLKSFGLTLGETIRGLVIGTRDQSQIYTSSGKTLFSAKGDPQAAVEAALGAVLDGADFVDETQRKLVESMRAAGKGFDEIAETLQRYADAQAVITAVQDEILRLTDPKAYDLKAVERAHGAQLKAAKEAFEAGLYTAEQFDALSAALERLNGLQVGEILARHGSAVADAEAALRDAYDAERAAIVETRAEFEALASSLRTFSDKIATAVRETLAPSQQLAIAERRFRGAATLAAQGDREALADLPQIADAFAQASEKYAPDAKTNQRNLASIRRGTEDALKAAEKEIDVAEQQLAALDATVSQLIELNKGVKSVADAIRDLKAARAAAAVSATGATGTPEHQQVKALEASGGGLSLGEFDADRYAAAAGDVIAEYQKYAAGSSAYQEFFRPGMSLEEYLRAHYDMTGRYEIAAGYRGYASGTTSAGPGGAWVGEQGPEWLQFRGGEQVVPHHALNRSGGADLGPLVAEVRALRSELTLLRASSAQIEKSSRKTSDTLVRVSRDGESLVTVAA